MDLDKTSLTNTKHTPSRATLSKRDVEHLRSNWSGSRVAIIYNLKKHVKYNPGDHKHKVNQLTNQHFLGSDNIFRRTLALRERSQVTTSPI